MHRGISIERVVLDHRVKEIGVEFAIRVGHGPPHKDYARGQIWS